MFKIRMQGQYGGADDKKLGQVVSDMWRNYGFRNGIMRGYMVGPTPNLLADIAPLSARLRLLRLLKIGDRRSRDSSLRRFLRRLRDL